MSKQVTKTIVKIASIEMVDGTPIANSLPDLELMGNVKMDKAQREVDKRFDNATVVQLETKKLIYEMEVEDFIKYATLKED